MRKQAQSTLEALTQMAASPDGERKPRSFVVVTHPDPPDVQKLYSTVPLRHHGEPVSDFDEPKRGPAS